MNKVLVVDNEKSLRDLLSIVLKKEGYYAVTAADGEEGLKILEKDLFDVVLTDIRMPKMDGLSLLQSVKQTAPETIVIMMTAFASNETTIRAMKDGAYCYLPKPVQMEEIKLVIKNALEERRLRRENAQMRKNLADASAFSSVISQSEKMKRVLDLVRRVADSKSNVLILGESGTGKELIARAIHFNSSRRDRPFVTVNCSALPEALLESELFGHMRGAFTGAVVNKEGLFEVAHEGTLFLDEIGETSLSIQVKLLRVIQEKEFRRLGGTRDVKVDVRVIAATNLDLEKAVAAGKFREDLYYRLDVICISIPPLRERPEDIPLLVNHFLAKFASATGKKIREITPEAMRLLTRYEWKGNVRELENVMERTVAFAAGEVLTSEDFSGALTAVPSPMPVLAWIPEGGIDLEELVGKIEKDLLLKALEETKWVKKEAAKLLKIPFRSFRYRLSKYGISKRNVSGAPASLLSSSQSEPKD